VLSPRHFSLIRSSKVVLPWFLLMARGKKRSREPELAGAAALPAMADDASRAAFTAGDDYFSSGAQKLKKATDASSLVYLASQHTAGYRELVDEV
jgi:hypothetical protein